MGKLINLKDAKYSRKQKLGAQTGRQPQPKPTHQFVPLLNIEEFVESLDVPMIGIIPSFDCPVEMICNQWEVLETDLETGTMTIRLTDIPGNPDHEALGED